MTQPDELDELTAELLLRGEVESSGAPPGYEQLAALIQQARQPATRQERMTLPALPYAHPIGVPRRRSAPAVRRAGGGGRRWVIPVAVAAAAVAVGATGAAAATGNLPGPAQSLAARVAGTVGVELPEAGQSVEVVVPVPAGAAPDATGGVEGDSSPGAAGDPSAEGTTSSQDTSAAPGSCRAFAAGDGRELGLLRDLYRIATADPNASVIDEAAARVVVAQLCEQMGVPLPAAALAAPTAPDASGSGTPPGLEQAPPAQEQPPPGQAQVPPGQATSSPAQEQAPPAQEQAPSGQEQAPSGQEQAPPGDATSSTGPATSLSRQGQQPPGRGQPPSGQTTSGTQADKTQRERTVPSTTGDRAGDAEGGDG